MKSCAGALPGLAREVSRSIEFQNHLAPEQLVSCSVPCLVAREELSGSTIAFLALFSAQKNGRDAKKNFIWCPKDGIERLAVSTLAWTHKNEKETQTWAVSIRGVLMSGYRSTHFSRSYLLPKQDIVRTDWRSAIEQFWQPRRKFVNLPDFQKKQTKLCKGILTWFQFACIHVESAATSPY